MLSIALDRSLSLSLPPVNEFHIETSETYFILIKQQSFVEVKSSCVDFLMWLGVGQNGDTGGGDARFAIKRQLF